MNINKIKERIEGYRGQIVDFKFNGSRNQIEEFKGEIINTYPSVFIVKMIDNTIIKSFSYTDILIRKLIIKN